MIKSELVHRLSLAYPHFYERDIKKMIGVVTKEITTALANGQRVELRSFGSFVSKQRAAHTGRNPRTGKQVQVAAKQLPHFRASKDLRARLNRN